MLRTTRGVAILLLVFAAGAVGIGQNAALKAPKFQVDPAWPKVPAQWTLGIVSSAAVDAQDHIWVLQRPLSLAPDERPRAAPPVLEFDNAGNFIQGWGGPAAGYDWPESEHGIHVDGKGFVWITGQGEEDQILKFTRAGKFVMQIGKRGQKKTNADTQNFWKPADIFVYDKTNEAFIADGYGNKRIIVVDAETGAFKRMWGAFGKVPVDGPGVAGAAEDGPPQFVNPVHAVKISRDGLVYVGDRGGKRVQVFTIEGRFVSQTFIAPESERLAEQECKAPECTSANTAAGIGFSTDPDQQFLYVANRSQARVMVFERKTFRLLDSFGRWGSAPGEFGTLHHMTVDSKGNIYVAEVTPLRPVNRRIQKFVRIETGG